MALICNYVQNFFQLISEMLSLATKLTHALCYGCSWAEMIDFHQATRLLVGPNQKKKSADPNSAIKFVIDQTDKINTYLPTYMGVFRRIGDKYKKLA